MLSFSGSLKVFVAVEACDMRKGFNGLHALVTQRLGEDPRAGALFVFTNKRHGRLKILCWDGTGFWVLGKRLEEGAFSWPKNLEPQITKLSLTPQALAMLTDGVDLRGGKLRQTVNELRIENALLRQKIDLLVKRVFGSSSEPLDKNQLELLAQPETTATAEAIVAAPEKERVERSRKERTTRWPENLPVVEEVLDPEPVKAQPEQWRCIGQEISEQLDYEPGCFLRRRVVRRKYVHQPERLLDRSLPAPGLLAHIVVGKYCDHLPLYRQEQIYQQRHGVHLPRQSLTRWVELTSQWLKPIYEQIRTGVMGGGYVQVDETPVAYLEPGHGKTRQGYLWMCSRPGGDVFYRWETSRAAACLDNIIPVDFNGTVQYDGYSAYRSFANGRNGTIELAAQPSAMTRTIGLLLLSRT